jgi:hypothetical protein
MKMSNNQIKSSNPAVADQPTDGNQGNTTFATTTRYQEIAAQFMSGLDALTALLPKLEAEHGTTINAVKGHLTVPNVFLASTIAAVEQTPDLQAFQDLDVVAGHDVLQFIEAFRPVANKVNALGRSLEFTMDSRKSALVVNALRVYDLAKSVARNPRNAAMGAHVKTMKRDLNRIGPKKSTLKQKAAKAAAEAAKAKAASEEKQSNADFKAGRDL